MTVESTFPYVWVDTEPDLHNLVSSIKAYRDACEKEEIRTYLYTDSEGRELGRTTGKLGLLQLGHWAQYPPEQLKVYLIDVIRLSDSVLQPLWSCLSDSDMIKVFWDARMDVTELHVSRGLVIEPILDLQVAEVMHRRGKKPIWYVHPVKSLRQAALDFSVLSAAQKDELNHVVPMVKEIHTTHQSEAWLQRPLKMTAYAASDVYAIALLHRHFHDAGILRESTTEALLATSKRYCGMYGLTRKPKEDIYLNHGFLATGILDPPSDKSVVHCVGCHRDIHVKYWPRNTSKQGNNFCSVCRFIQTRRGIKQE